MKVFITGCTGNVGRIAAKKLGEMGAEVVSYSLDDAKVEGVSEYKTGDILDYETLKSAMTGCDRVLHLAAIKMPFHATEEKVFQINACGTFNVFKACAQLGIKRLAIASSPNAIGYNFGIKLQDISYLPVDGVHPLYTTDPYSFAKQTIEEIGQYFYRRYGISSVFLRLGLDFLNNVEDWIKLDKTKSDLKYLRSLIDDLLKLPEKERSEEVRRIENESCEKRDYAMNIAPPYDNGTEYAYAYFTKEQDIWNYYIHNFLMFLDRRDLADAIYSSLISEFEGAHNLFIADDKNLIGIESAKLSFLYPGAKANFDLLKGYDALVDYRYTQKIIGYKAKHSVSDFYSDLYGE